MVNVVQTAERRGILIENDDDWTAVKMMLGEIVLGMTNSSKPNKEAALFIQLAIRELDADSDEFDF
jgi:hypothetical protein